MATEPPGPRPIAARVEQLETEVRRMKRLGMAAALLVGVVLGASFSRRGNVSARSLTLVDREDRPRLTVEVGAGGEAELTVVGPEAARAVGTIRVRDGAIEFRPR